MSSELCVDVFTNGIIGPNVKMLGPVADGGKITFLTAPGCWGPMITPTLRGGHEVCTPVTVENADIGDAVAIYIEEIKVKSKAASSGVDESVEGTFVGDPYVAKRCPKCREPWPEFNVEGIGREAIRCKNCGEIVPPFRMIHGYTMVFDENRSFGLTVDEKFAEEIARKAHEYSALPEKSKQVPILVFGKADIVGLASRIRPFMGQLGTVPAVNIPDSHNAGDFGSFLINAPHPYRITKEQYERDLTDGHLDVDSVRAGAVLIAPVKVKGAGIYAGDAHAVQGDGEVAGHTTDITAEVKVKVEVLKDFSLDGPILLPLEEDLPPLAKPWRKDEWDQITSLAKKYGIEPEPVAPVQIIGSGPTINDAATNGFQRAAKLFNMSVEEVRNRVTVTGAVEIGRLPGIVQVSMQVPIRILEELGIADLVTKHYKLPY
ncbi:MAG: acetamidase/formamidase family protein [Candidatus Baldrarchaeia archaeon]